NHGRGAADTLFVGTNDFSWLLKDIKWLDPLLRSEYGFDIFASTNGWFWSLQTKNGFGHPFDFGARTFASAPTAAFVGTANHAEGTRVWAILDPPTPGRSFAEPGDETVTAPGGELNPGTPPAITIPGVPAAACTPRPNIRVTTVPSGSEALQATVAATVSEQLPINTLKEIQFHAGDNALVDIAGRTPGSQGDFSITVPTGTTEASFV